MRFVIKTGYDRDSHINRKYYVPIFQKKERTF